MLRPASNNNEEKGGFEFRKSMELHLIMGQR